LQIHRLSPGAPGTGVSLSNWYNFHAGPDDCSFVTRALLL
jgi:hypothetical protein